MEKNTSALVGEYVQPALHTIVPLIYCQGHLPTIRVSVGFTQATLILTRTTYKHVPQRDI
jgi:hypothetical protein